MAAAVGVLVPVFLLSAFFGFIVYKRRGSDGFNSNIKDNFEKFKRGTVPEKNGNNDISVAANAVSVQSLEVIPVSDKVDPSKDEIKSIIASNKANNKEKEISKNAPSSSAPPKVLNTAISLSSTTLARKKKEHADEAEFEALFANNGKRSTPPSAKAAAAVLQSPALAKQVSYNDDELMAEFDSVVAKGLKPKNISDPPTPGRNKRAHTESSNPGFVSQPNVPDPDARPQSEYLKSIDVNRRSIFRPSSLFLSKARKQKTLDKLVQEPSKPKESSTKNLNIDEDI